MTGSLLDLTSAGPYNVVEYTDSITVAGPGGSRTCRGTAQDATIRLPLTVTLPTSEDPRSQSSVLQDCPVVLFFNGFQSRACWYRAYTHRLASWGFAVVQYTTPILKVIKDKDEIKFMDPLLSWAQNSTSTSGHFAHGCFDLDSLCVTGHSRGGKLAALHFASNNSFKAACLIDPVDNTTYTPESEDYPSACRALAGCKKPVAVLGCRIIGPANPDSSNWHRFFAAAAPGSWLQVLNRAGHGQFWHISRAVDWLVDRALGAGSDSRQQVLVNTVPAMVAWFTQQLQQQAPAAALRYKQGPARLAAAAALAGSAAMSPTTQVAMATAGMPLVACEAAAGLRLASWQQQGSGGGQALLGALLPARVLPVAGGSWEKQEAQEVRGVGDGWRGAVGPLRLPSVEDVKRAFDAWLKGSEADGEVSFSTK